MPTKNAQFVAKFNASSLAQFVPSFAAGGGGVTIEADLTISAFSGMTPGKNTIFEPEITLSVFSDIVPGKNTIFEPGLTVSNILSTDPILANSVLDTAIVLSSTLLSEYSYTASLEAAISFINSLSTIQNSIAIYETNGVYDIVHGTENSAQADINGAVLLTHQVGLQTVVQAVMNAGLTLSSISNITVNGSVLSLEVTLPCGRTLLVSIENRILQIQADNRTISINGCN